MNSEVLNLSDLKERAEKHGEDFDISRKDDDVNLIDSYEEGREVIQYAVNEVKDFLNKAIIYKRFKDGALKRLDKLIKLEKGYLKEGEDLSKEVVFERYFSEIAEILDGRGFSLYGLVGLETKVTDSTVDMGGNVFDLLEMERVMERYPDDLEGLRRFVSENSAFLVEIYNYFISNGVLDLGILLDELEKFYSFREKKRLMILSQVIKDKKIREVFIKYKDGLLNEDVLFDFLLKFESINIDTVSKFLFLFDDPDLLQKNNVAVNVLSMFCDVRVRMPLSLFNKFLEIVQDENLGLKNAKMYLDIWKLYISTDIFLNRCFSSEVGWSLEELPKIQSLAEKVWKFFYFEKNHHYLKGYELLPKVILHRFMLKKNYNPSLEEIKDEIKAIKEIRNDFEQEKIVYDYVIMVGSSKDDVTGSYTYQMNSRSELKKNFIDNARIKQENVIFIDCNSNFSLEEIIAKINKIQDEAESKGGKILLFLNLHGLSESLLTSRLTLKEGKSGRDLNIEDLSKLARRNTHLIHDSCHSGAMNLLRLRKTDSDFGLVITVADISESSAGEFDSLMCALKEGKTWNEIFMDDQIFGMQKNNRAHSVRIKDGEIF